LSKNFCDYLWGVFYAYASQMEILQSGWHIVVCFCPKTAITACKIYASDETSPRG
jgi:hypothetical protein